MTHKTQALKPEFVDFMPDELQPGILYVSMQFKSIQHLCCCGCGRKVVTPLSPTGWRMEFDGRSISLNPSIGNWQKDCKSHYFVIENQIRWAPSWSEKEISLGIKNDVQSKLDYYVEKTFDSSKAANSEPQEPPRKRSFIVEAWWKLVQKLF